MTQIVTGMLDELGWLPLFERRTRLTVFHKIFNIFSAISLDRLSVSSVTAY